MDRFDHPPKEGLWIELKLLPDQVHFIRLPET
jgi:hypothetical protein